LQFVLYGREMSAPRLHSSKNTTHFTFYFILVVLEEGVITPYFTAFYFTSSWMKERGGHYPLLRWLLLYSGRDGGGGYYPLLHRLLLYSGRERREGVITPFFAGFYYTPVVMEEGVITPYFTGFYFTLVVNEGRGSLSPSSLAFTILRS